MSRLLGVARALMRLPPPQISGAQAVKIAMAEAARRGVPPMRSEHVSSADPFAQERLRNWEVWLDPGFRPCRVVVVDNQTGEIKAYIAPPR